MIRKKSEAYAIRHWPKEQMVYRYLKRGGRFIGACKVGDLCNCKDTLVEAVDKDGNVIELNN